MSSLRTGTDLEASRFTVTGALYTGRSGHSYWRAIHGTDQVGRLGISPAHLTLSSWFLPRYEFSKNVIERLIFRERRILKALRFAQLRIIHKLPDAPEYILFVTCNPEELKPALTATGFEISETQGAPTSATNS